MLTSKRLSPRRSLVLAFALLTGVACAPDRGSVDTVISVSQLDSILANPPADLSPGTNLHQRLVEVQQLSRRGIRPPEDRLTLGALASWVVTRSPGYAALVRRHGDSVTVVDGTIQVRGDCREAERRRV